MKETINLGSRPGDGTGDSLRVAGEKINRNFNEVFNFIDEANLQRGPTGATGDTGPEGPQGSQGYTGSTGNIGFTGSQGAQGSQGINGFTGSSGTVGFTGSRGFTGSSGTVGFTGSQGDIGYTGSEGIGFTGSQGDTGYTGSQGDIGYTGSEGIGFTGSQGDVGFTGSQGDVGFTGSQGDIGFTGSQGDTGYTGSQGDIGYTGSQGIPGEAAAIGYTGSAGAAGSSIFPVVTTSDLTDPTNAINTTGKAQGKPVWTTNDHLIYVASDSAAAAVWHGSDGTTVQVPYGSSVSITGTFEVGQFFMDSNFVGSYYPSPPPGITVLSDQTPLGILTQIVRASDTNTYITFTVGTWGSYYVYPGYVNGRTFLSATIDGITQTTVLEASGGTTQAKWTASDVFSLASKVGQTLSFSITIT